MVEALPDRMESARLRLQRLRADDAAELVSLINESFEASSGPAARAEHRPVDSTSVTG